MIVKLAELLSFDFFTRALIAGTLISLCAALLGVSLVLKRFSMIGDGLSHVGFGALAIASAAGAAPLAVAVPILVLAAFLLLRISENAKIKGDAAIALISAGSLAAGVIITSVTGTNTDVNNYLFGSILAMDEGGVILSAALAVIVSILFILFYNRIFAVTFDETFSRAVGIRAGVYNAVFAVLTAVTVVLGMRMMGALLISSLLVFPALTSMRICKRFITVTVCSAVVSVSCFLIGITASSLLETPPGASIVAVNAAFFIGFWAIGLLTRKFPSNGRTFS